MKTNEKRSFWLPLSSWNLSEIFVTESISPHSFYEKREFGTKNNQITDDLGKALQADNCLVLYPNQFSFTPKMGKPSFLYISESALDNNFLTIDENGLGYYYKTIFLNRGNFQLRFFNEFDKKMFLANSSVSLEVKTFKKYDIDFFKEGTQSILFIGSEPKEKNSRDINLLFASKELDTQPFFDKAYNQIKGFIYGFLCGTIGRKSGQEVQLETELLKLKSKVNALRTFFEMSEIYSQDIFDVTFSLVETCEGIFKNTLSENTENNFIGIKARLQELQNLQKLRLAETQRQKQFANSLDKNEAERIKQQLDALYQEKQPLKIQQEKMRDEKKRLQETEKSIKRPAKFSPEYDKKQELKQQIEELQDKINEVSAELKPINEQIQSLNFELNKFQSLGRTQYDSNIEEQFYKISGYITDLIFTSNQQVTDNQRKNDLPILENFKFDIKGLSDYYYGIHKQENFIISFGSPFFDNLSDIDKKLLNIVINSAFSYPNGILGDISESTITNILELVLERTQDLHNEEITTSLSNLLNYRLTRNGDYSIPENQVVLKCFMAFIIKPNSAEELTKFMYSKEISELHIAFSIWGAFFGFANMPKTFTNIIFESGNNELFEMIDNYLFNNYLALREQ